MAVKYGEFTFAKSPARPSANYVSKKACGGSSTPMAYAKGGSVSTPFAYKSGGLTKPRSPMGRGGSEKHGIGLGKSVKTHQAKEPGVQAADKGKKNAAAKGYAAGGVTKYSGHAGPRPNLATAGAGAKGLKDKTSKDPGPTKADTGKRDSLMKPAFKKGGSTTPYAYKEGGEIDTAEGAVKMGKKSSWNKDDAVSPGSSKRTPPSQAAKNKAAASDKFATTGRNTEPATKQDGDVERMSGWSDFKKGGSTSRIKNLGHYAHGGKVKASAGEKPSGKAGSSKVAAPVKKASAGEYEAKAGTPKKAPGSRSEIKSGEVKMAMGGLSRGTSPKRNAAIHAKAHHKGPSGGGLAAVANALSGMGSPHQPSAPGQGPAPPGMAPDMGSPPGSAGGATMPSAPTMGGGPPAMASGGNVRHVMIHHISHGKR